MWDLLHRLFGYSEAPNSAGNSNATPINVEQLVSLYEVNREHLILVDLRPSAEVERFPYAIPEALLTTRVKLLSIADWIPPQSIVVLYGAERISAHADVIACLPQNAHFYLFEGGLRSWRQARLPLEPVNQFLLEEAPVIWKPSNAVAKREESHDAHD